MKHSIYNRIIVVLGSFTIIAITIFILPSYDNVIESYNQKQKAIIPPKIFPTISVRANAAIIFDIEKNKTLFSKNPNEQLPLASITKIMTVLIAVENLDLNDSIAITNQDLAGGSNGNLVAGDTWKIKNLIDYTLVTSANGGASALARKVATVTGEDFISLMNKKSEELRLDNTYFINATGLDIGDDYGGSYGSAKDIAILISHIVSKYPNLLTASSKNSVYVNSESGKIYTGNNTNNIVGEIPGLIASKTGFTYNAGGNLAIVFDTGLRQPIAVVVLGSTKETRFADVKKLVDSTINFFAD